MGSAGKHHFRTHCVHAHVGGEAERLTEIKKRQAQDDEIWKQRYKSQMEQCTRMLNSGEGRLELLLCSSRSGTGDCKHEKAMCALGSD